MIWNIKKPKNCLFWKPLKVSSISFNYTNSPINLDYIKPIPKIKLEKINPDINSQTTKIHWTLKQEKEVECGKSIFG